METPSIKGFVMAPGLARLKALHEQGDLKTLGDHPQDDVIEHLLDSGAAPTFWYPMAAQDRIGKLLMAAEGAGDPGYWVRVGRESADEILSARTIEVLLTGARAFGERAGGALVRMASLAFSVGDWRYEGDRLEEFHIVVDAAEELPESVRYNTEGFIGVLADRFVGVRMRVASHRPAHDRIVFEGVTA